MRRASVVAYSCWVCEEAYEGFRNRSTLPPDTGVGKDAREPGWRDRCCVDGCFVFMCVCARRTSTSLPVCGTSAARRTATALLSSMRPWLALGAWASNPFWPVGRRALRAKRGAFATEAAKSCRSGGPPTGRKPTARGGLDQSDPRNTVRQPATWRATMTGRRRTG